MTIPSVSPNPPSWEKHGFKPMGRLWRDAFLSWRKDNPALIAGGLSFFTLFSFAPLMILAYTLGRKVFQMTMARNMFIERVSDVVSPEAAAALNLLLLNVDRRAATATVASTLFLVWGGSRVFDQMQRAFDLIWSKDVDVHGHEPRPGHVRRVARAMGKRLRAFAMVAAFGVVFAAFFFVDIALAAFQHFMTQYFSPTLVSYTLPVSSHACSLAIFTLSFALLFKFLPPARVAWRDVWAGALVTSALFVLGRFLFSLYFHHANLVSIYGAAGSVVATLLWIYFSMQILLFGAEFTWVYAHRLDRRARRLHATESRGA